MRGAASRSLDINGVPETENRQKSDLHTLERSTHLLTRPKMEAVHNLSRGPYLDGGGWVNGDKKGQEEGIPERLSVPALCRTPKTTTFIDWVFGRSRRNGRRI